MNSISRIVVCSVLIKFALPCSANISSSDGASSIDSESFLILGSTYAKKWKIKKIGCFKVINISLKSETILERGKRFSTVATSKNAAGVVIWGFVNDLRRGTDEEVDLIRNAIKNNIKSMVETAKENDMIPVLSTELTLGESKSLKWKVMSWISDFRGRQTYKDFINSEVLALNNWIRAYAKKNNIYVLDIEKLLTDSNGNRIDGYAMDDGNMLPDLAYTVVTKYLIPDLEKALIEANSMCS